MTPPERILFTLDFAGAMLPSCVCVCELVVCCICVITKIGLTPFIAFSEIVNLIRIPAYMLTFHSNRSNGIYEYIIII